MRRAAETFPARPRRPPATAMRRPGRGFGWPPRTQVRDRATRRRSRGADLSSWGWLCTFPLRPWRSLGLLAHFGPLSTLTREQRSPGDTQLSGEGWELLSVWRRCRSALAGRGDRMVRGRTFQSRSGLAALGGPCLSLIPSRHPDLRHSAPKGALGRCCSTSALQDQSLHSWDMAGWGEGRS